MVWSLCEQMRLVGDGASYRLVHQELLGDLLLLCTSTYSQVRPATAAASHSSPLASQQLRLQVRSRAQALLASALASFSYAYRDLVPRILQLLQPQQAHGAQHQVKVAARQLTQVRLHWLAAPQLA